MDTKLQLIEDMLKGMNKGKKRKLVLIDMCSQCHHCIHDDANFEERWGKYWCLKLDRKVAETTINKNCPL